MGRYSDGLSSRMRSRRVAEGIEHPHGVGMAMWCSACRALILRVRSGEQVSQVEQQAAYDAHLAVCELRGMNRTRTRRQIERGARRLLRLQWWRKYRAPLLASALLLAGLYLLTRH